MLGGFGRNDNAFEADMAYHIRLNESKMRAAAAEAAEEAERKAAEEAERAAKEARAAAEAQATAEAAAQAEAADKRLAEMQAAQKELEDAKKELEEAKAAAAATEKGVAAPVPTLLEMAVIISANIGFPASPLVELAKVACERFGVDQSGALNLKERVTACYDKLPAMARLGTAVPLGYAYGVDVSMDAVPMGVAFTADPNAVTFDALPMAIPMPSPEVGEAIPVGFVFQSPGPEA